ncbi:MAG: hypothetical protein V4636_24250, partial [Pseudomonadota bacterium]
MNLNAMLSPGGFLGRARAPGVCNATLQMLGGGRLATYRQKRRIRWPDGSADHAKAARHGDRLGAAV